MPSTFSVYSSSTGGAGNPGQITGVVGDLLRILDKCLVNGWTGVAAAGWTKPIANSGNMGCYQQGAGSGFVLFINDNGPNGTSLAREAWGTGWETIAGVGGPVGTGTGQFPTPAQLLTTGHVSIRKTSDTTTPRNWILFADASTFYLFTSSDTAGTYNSFMFGDVFSVKSTADTYKCAIMGISTENTGTGSGMDIFSAANAAVNGAFMARTYGGGGASVTIGRHGDAGKCASQSTGWVGQAQTPNGPDAAWYMSPIWVTEPSANIIRGRLRGAYMLAHPITAFSDGQTFSGAGDYTGKTFYVVKVGTNGGMFVMETSATVETN